MGVVCSRSAGSTDLFNSTTRRDAEIKVRIGTPVLKGLNAGAPSDHFYGSRLGGAVNVITYLIRTAGELDDAYAGQVKATIKGPSVEATYEGVLPFDSKVVYPVTNEKIDEPILDVLRAIEGVRYFIGIAGSGEVPALMLRELGKSNKIETCTFVDKDANQALVALLALLRLPALSAKTEVIADDITDVVQSSSRKGKYFIYLSNVFEIPDNNGNPFILGYADRYKTLALINAMANNDNIAPGSVAIAIKAGSSDFALLRKEDTGSVKIWYSLRNNAS